jgi:hypothetical protein
MEEGQLVIHMSLPAGAPVWLMSLSCVGIILIGVIYSMVRLARAMLPDSSADRLSWWTEYWSHRRELRHDRWKRRDEQRARHQVTESWHHSDGLPIQPANTLAEKASSATSGSSSPRPPAEVSSS